MMIYLLHGDDLESKEKKIAEIKSKALPSIEAHEFDYQSLYSQKLDPAELKKALITLPVMQVNRLVVIRGANKLIAANKEIILTFLKSKPDYIVLVLDFDEVDARDAFLTQMKTFGKAFDFSKGVKENVFDMTNAMSARNPQEALRILNQLISEGAHPLQIMGGLVWYWGKNKNRLHPARFEKGLNELQEADLNIKRSRLNPEQALEVLIVKLVQA